jgi:hypothetical protein
MMEYEQVNQPHPLGQWVLVGDTLVREKFALYMEFSGGGQGKAPKPVTKIRGSQDRQRNEKDKWRIKLPKIKVPNPWSKDKK